MSAQPASRPLNFWPWFKLRTNPLPGSAEPRRDSNPAESVTQNSASSSPQDTPPTITINGANPAIIQVGDNYADLGATVTDAGPGQADDANLGLRPSSTVRRGPDRHRHNRGSHRHHSIRRHRQRGSHRHEHENRPHRICNCSDLNIAIKGVRRRQFHNVSAPVLLKPVTQQSFERMELFTTRA